MDLGAPNEKLPLPVIRKTGQEHFGANLASIFTKPAEDQSWVKYDNSLRITHQDEVSVLKRLPVAAILTSAAAVVPFAAPAPGYLAPYVSTPSLVIQERAAPTYIVVMEGSARRAGYQIPAPQLVTVGGARAVPQNEPGYGFVSKVSGNWGGVPIVSAAWRLKYVLTGKPTQVSLPPNPVLSVGKVAGVAVTGAAGGAVGG